MKIELTADELQVLAQALDSYVRAHGLKVATNVAVILQKLEDAAGKQPQPEEVLKEWDKTSDP